MTPVFASWLGTLIRWSVQAMLAVVFILSALALLYLVAVVGARAYQRVFRR